jgi:hypothetical protein
MLPRQNPSRLEVLVLPGSCLKGNGICEPFSSDRMPRNTYKPRLVMQRRQGKLYILVGLRRCDRAAYQKVFDSLARPNDDVEVARGCMISREPFRQLLSEVQDGRFDDYLSRPPW